jgi:acyl-CoA thioester hydrolase
MPALRSRDSLAGAHRLAAGQPATGECGHAPDAADFACTLRVYWEDTDAGGVVFYANYLKFFERARTEWLRQLGVQQQALRDDTGAIFVVADTHISYHAPARLDDELRVTVALKARGSASMTMAQQAWRGSTLLAQGQIRIGCVDAGTFRPRRIPTVVTNSLPAAAPRT